MRKSQSFFRLYRAVFAAAEAGLTVRRKNQIALSCTKNHRAICDIDYIHFLRCLI